MVLLFRLPSGNIRYLSGKCTAIWEGLFSASRYADCHMFLQADYLRGTVFVVHCFCHVVWLEGKCTPNLVVSAYTTGSLRTGTSGHGSGNDTGLTDNQIQGSSGIGRIRNTALDVCHANRVSHISDPGKMEMAAVSI